MDKRGKFNKFLIFGSVLVLVVFIVGYAFGAVTLPKVYHNAKDIFFTDNRGNPTEDIATSLVGIGLWQIWTEQRANALESGLSVLNRQDEELRSVIDRQKVMINFLAEQTGKKGLLDAFVAGPWYKPYAIRFLNPPSVGRCDNQRVDVEFYIDSNMAFSLPSRATNGGVTYNYAAADSNAVCQVETNSGWEPIRVTDAPNTNTDGGGKLYSSYWGGWTASNFKSKVKFIVSAPPGEPGDDNEYKFRVRCKFGSVWQEPQEASILWNKLYPHVRDPDCNND